MKVLGASVAPVLDRLVALYCGALYCGGCVLDCARGRRCDACTRWHPVRCEEWLHRKGMQSTIDLHMNRHTQLTSCGTSSTP